MPRKPTSEIILCTVPGCRKRSNVPGASNGFCGAHYQRFRRYGDPLGVAAKRVGPVQKWVNETAVQFTGGECLIWPFYRNDKGYAAWSINGRPRMAHRIIFEMVSGPPPSPSHVAAHNCFNGDHGCVNPNHIRWATASENEQDKVLSGTSNRGAQHGLSKLTENDVRAIRRLEGVKQQKEIAEMFGVSKWTVGDIIRRKRWGWLA